MALVPIKTASTTGYCDCICGCYELASQRDDETGKGYCPRCAKEHLEMNRGVGIPQLAPSKLPEKGNSQEKLEMPETADPPARLR
jgi:hypothetical protein